MDTINIDTALAAMEIVADEKIKGYNWERTALNMTTFSETRSGYLPCGYGGETMKGWQKARLVSLGLIEKTCEIKYDPDWPPQSFFDAPVVTYGDWKVTELGKAVLRALGN